MTFKVGDIVAWTSSGGGHKTEKLGVVVEVIPSRTSALNGRRKELSKKYRIPFDGGSRPFESYLVEVQPVNGKGKPTLYWPLVKNLKLIKE